MTIRMLFVNNMCIHDVCILCVHVCIHVGPTWLHQCMNAYNVCMYACMYVLANIIVVHIMLCVKHCYVGIPVTWILLFLNVCLYCLCLDLSNAGVHSSWYVWITIC